MFTDNLWMLSGSIIVEGKIGKYLIGPLNLLFQLIAEKFQPDRFGEIIIGIFLLVTSCLKLNMSFTFAEIVPLLFIIP